MPRLSLFCGAEYFALAWRSGQTFDGKPYRLQEAAHSAFCAICGQDAAVGHRVIDAAEDAFRPHLRLLFRSESVEIDHIDAFWQQCGGDIAENLVECELRRDGCRCVPRRCVQPVLSYRRQEPPPCGCRRQRRRPTRGSAPRCGSQCAGCRC